LTYYFAYYSTYEIAYYEGLILAAFNPVNSCGSWIDNITATYQSISQTIFAGSNYNASIFLTSSRNDFKSSVIFNGDTTSIEEDSCVTIKFKASGENYDENGIIKKFWTAKVAIPDHQGSYCYKELKGTYFVYKPKVVVSGNATTALYEQCANTLSIKVPSLGENYKPIFSCNAPTKRGIVNTELVVVPRSKEDVKLKIYTKDILIDSTTFKVTPVPLPNFQIYANSSAINPKVGITSKTKKLSLKVIPDEGFASLFPSEAKYSIGKIQANIYHGSKLIKSFNVSNPEIPIPKSKADRIVIEVLKLYRTNSLGKKIAVNLKSKRVLSVFIVD
jgi:gliding motility-associated protein GldM